MIRIGTKDMVTKGTVSCALHWAARMLALFLIGWGCDALRIQWLAHNSKYDEAGHAFSLQFSICSSFIPTLPRRTITGCSNKLHL